MSRNDYISEEGELNLDKIFDNIDSNSSQLADIVQQTTIKIKAVQLYFRSDSGDAPKLDDIISNDTLFNTLKNDGVTDIVLVPILRVDLSTDFVTQNFSNAKLTTLINKLISNYGFKLHLKCHMEDSNWHAVFGEGSDITDANTFFSQYKSILIGILALDTENFKTVCMSNESPKLAAQYRIYWESLIIAIKAQNFNIRITDNGCFYDTPTCFIDLLDYLGGNFYPYGSNDETTSIIDFKKGWYEVISTVNKVCKQYNKDFILTETGIFSNSYAGQNPANCSNDIHNSWNTTNQDIQKNYYSALLEIMMNFDKCVGIWLWNCIDSYTFVGNSAEQMVQQYYKGV